jgi:hypothetical protein
MRAGLVEAASITKDTDWWSEENCRSAKVDIERLRAMLIDRSLLNLRGVGKSSFILLCGILGVSSEKPKVEKTPVCRCPHCGQRLPKEMRSSVTA